MEALGELEDLARDAMRNYPTLDPRDMRWVLVEAAGRILPELPEDLAAYAQVQLERRRIEVLLDMRLDSTEGGAIRLSDGQAFEADTLVWTAGVKPSPLAGLGGFPVDERGRIVVDDHLRVVGVPDAWAAGDIAAVPDRTTGGLAPPTAQHAMREGRRLGKNITATLLGGELAPFVWRNVGGVCSLGRYKGVANVFGIKVKGFLGLVPAPLLPPVGDADDRPTRADRDRLDDRAAVPARHHAVRLVRGSSRAVPARGEPVDRLPDAATRLCAAASADRSRPGAPCGSARCPASRVRPRAPPRPIASGRGSR